MTLFHITPLVSSLPCDHNFSKRAHLLGSGEHQFFFGSKPDVRFFLISFVQPDMTPPTAMNLVCRNSFPKLLRFPLYFTQLGKFRGEANVEKHADPGKNNRNSRKSRENSRNLLEAFLWSRKEENLYGHCDVNNARRILSKGSTVLRGCWIWSKKHHFQKNFGPNFIAVEGVISRPVLKDFFFCGPFFFDF